MDADPAGPGKQIRVEVREDAQGVARALRITKGTEEDIESQEFRLDELAGVTALEINGTAGDDVIYVAPEVTEVFPISHIIVNAGAGNDRVDFGQGDPTRSRLRSTSVDGGDGD